jgi:hypothetical protein
MELISGPTTQAGPTQPIGSIGNDVAAGAWNGDISSKSLHAGLSDTSSSSDVAEALRVVTGSGTYGSKGPSSPGGSGPVGGGGIGPGGSGGGSTTCYPDPVPDGGMTATMVGATLLGLAGLRRRFGAKRV